MAQGVLEQGAQDARGRPRIARRPHRLGRDELNRHVGRVRGRGDLGRHRSGELAQLDRLARQRRVAVQPPEVEEVLGEGRHPVGLAMSCGGAPADSPQIRRAARELLLQKFDRAAQRRQRRAQLVRGGGEEGLAAALLGMQARAHRLQGQRHLAHLVAVAVDGQWLLDPVVGQPPRVAAQPLEAAQQSVAQGDPEPRGDEDAHAAGHRQGTAHDRDGGARVVQRLAQHERAAPGAGADRGDDDRLAPRHLIAHVARSGEAGVDEPLGRRRARLAALGIGVGQLDAVLVEESHPAAHTARQLAHDGLLALRAGAQVAARQPRQPEVRGACELAHVAQAIGGQTVLERGHERGHGRDERDRAGGQQGDHELRPQPGPAPAHRLRPSGGTPRRGR